MINQKSFWDCSIASTAMFLNISYEIVLKKAKLLLGNSIEGLGLNSKEELKLLNEFGKKCKIVYELKRGDRALVTVPSLNDAEGLHCVFFDGNKLIDPNFNNKEKNFYKKCSLDKFPIFYLAIVLKEGK